MIRARRGLRCWPPEPASARREQASGPAARPEARPRWTHCTARPACTPCSTCSPRQPRIHRRHLRHHPALQRAALLHRRRANPPWPPILGLYRAVVVALTYLRRNRVQAELAETYDVSQSTISRAITGLTPILKSMLTEFVPTADKLDPRTQYIVDSSLLLTSIRKPAHRALLDWEKEFNTQINKVRYVIEQTSCEVSRQPADPPRLPRCP